MPRTLRSKTPAWQSLYDRRATGSLFIDNLQSGSLITEHCFNLEIFFKAENPIFATIARLLLAAERHATIRRRAVEIDAAGADLRGNPARAVDIAGLNIAREPI